MIALGRIELGRMRLAIVQESHDLRLVGILHRDVKQPLMHTYSPVNATKPAVQTMRSFSSTFRLTRAKSGNDQGDPPSCLRLPGGSMHRSHTDRRKAPGDPRLGHVRAITAPAGSRPAPSPGSPRARG